MSRINALERLAAMSKDAITDVFKAALDMSGISYTEGIKGEPFPGLGFDYTEGFGFTISSGADKRKDTKYVGNTEFDRAKIQIQYEMSFSQEGSTFGFAA